MGNNIMSTKHTKLISLLAGLLFACSASAVTTYTDNFSGASSNLNWLHLDDACLTAGNGTGSIPACVTPTDPVGSGALRLTPATNGQTGAILSNFTFPLSQGMQVTFTTYTYGGDSGGQARNGADGIAFMLTDGSKPAPTTAGALGGSLGYSCSNVNAKYQGMANAYLGLGIDEYGNFLNSGDNTNTGIYNSNYSPGVTTYGTNSYASNSYYQPERIGLRGAGNTTWAWLQSQNPTYYSGSTPSASKVQAACRSGQYVSGTNDDGNNTYSSIPYNYKAIPGGYRVLPDNTKIANETAKTRTAAQPITYKLTLSPTGLLNFSYSYNNGAFQPVLTNSLITNSNGPLPPSFRFGFSAGTGGSNNVHEITCFQASPLQSNSSAGTNTIQSGQYRTSTQIYLASYSTDNWLGSLTATSLVVSNNALAVNTAANWDAKCVLTGGVCAAMGTDASGNPISVAVQGPSARTLMTSASGSLKGQAFEWTSLSSAQQTVLNGLDNLGQQRVDWLRGGRTNEQLQSPPGNLRARTSVLGDIIDSSPTWVGAPYTGTYPDAFSDALYGNSATLPENNASAMTYGTFVSNNATRLNVVYVGSNDGFLHAFEAGAYDSSGNYVSTNNDGKEVLGFMPADVLANGGMLNLTNPNYVHQYFVDATPVASDLFYGNAWHTWLVGGVGTGGSEIYALDITDPTQFTETNASSVVIGDWDNKTAGLSHLGQTVGTPIVARLHNGQWAIIFGNGLNGTQSAGVYIGLVDSTTGAVSFQFLDTGVGSSSSPDGIAYVTSADLDGDHIADYLYAGDTQGNMWRFNLTDKNPARWAVSKFGNSSATPLYVARDGSGNRQPITTAPSIAAVVTGGATRVMVMFGTGNKTPFTSISGDVYATGTQTFYGIWDWDMSGWNGVANASSQYASLTGPQAVTRSQLLQQTVVSTTISGSTGYRYLSTSNKVCWQGSTACASNNNQYGWLFDLPVTQEQIIYNPVIINGAVVVSTAIPPAISALQCNPGLQSGYTMAFDPGSGGGLPQGFFPGPGGGFGTAGNGSVVGGIRLNAVGSPSTVKYGGLTYIVTQTVNGSAALSQVNPPTNQSPSRVSWRELRN